MIFRFFISRTTHLILLSFFLTAVHIHANERIPWSMDEQYNGSFQDSFNRLRWDIPNIIRQISINMSVRVGLEFQEGWAYPLIVKFVDDTPPGSENALAYVQIMSDGEKTWQSLNINLKAYESERFNFEKVFSHELVHAMLNDAVGFDAASQIPLWFHEGLAVYGADHGEQMVKVYVQQNPNQKEDYFLNGLEGPHGPLDYAEDYMAIQYIHDRHGVTGLHNLIREIVARKGDIAGSIEYACLEDWASFQGNAKAFAIDKIRDIKRQRYLQKPTEKPY